MLRTPAPLTSVLGVGKHVKPVFAHQLEQSIRGAGLLVASPNTNIGREITFPGGPKRTVVIHDSNKNFPNDLIRILEAILLLKATWLLLPRYGSADQLQLLSPGGKCEAIEFEAQSNSEISSWLATRDVSPGSLTADLYLLGQPSAVLVTLNHHTHDAGTIVELDSIHETNTLLIYLNERGNEFEVLSVSGRTDR